MRLSFRQQIISTLALPYNRDDSAASKKVAKFRSRGQSWRVDGLDSWQAEDIFKRLREFGIQVSSVDFRTAALDAKCPDMLIRKWKEESLALSEEKDEFVLQAAEELWERFVPDIPCPEMFCRKIEKSFLSSDITSDVRDELVAADVVFFVLDFVKYFTNLPEDQRRAALDFVEHNGLFPIEAILDNLFFYYQSYFYKQPEFLDALLSIFSAFSASENETGNAGQYRSLLADAEHTSGMLEREQVCPKENQKMGPLVCPCGAEQTSYM